MKAESNNNKKQSNRMMLFEDLLFCIQLHHAVSSSIQSFLLGQLESVLAAVVEVEVASVVGDPFVQVTRKRRTSSVDRDRRVLSYGLHLAFFGFGVWIDDGCLVFGLDDGDVIGQWFLRTLAVFGVVRQHDLHLNTEHTLTEKDVSNGVLNVIVHWVTRVNHQAIKELHRFGTLTT